jgi:hypothetical protein
VVSPKNQQRKEPSKSNYHAKFGMDYDSTMNFIHNPKMRTLNNENGGNDSRSPIYKKFTSVINEFYDVPVEIKSAKFKIRCICPEMFGKGEPDIKRKLNATKYEIFKNTNTCSTSPTRKPKTQNTSSRFIELNPTNQTNKDDDTAGNDAVKAKKSERSSKFHTPVHTESTLVTRSTLSSNRLFSPSDKKLFAIANNKKLSETLGIMMKKDSSKNLYSPSVNMSKKII